MLVSEIKQLVPELLKMINSKSMPIKGSATLLEAEIADSENKVGFNFPIELKELLRLCNGIQTGFGTLLGVLKKNDFSDILKFACMSPGWVEERWLPICNDECGNFYVVDCKSNSPCVYFIDAAFDINSLAYIVSSNVWYFIYFYLTCGIEKTDNWPIEKKYVTFIDPDILNFSLTKYPWETD